MVRSQYDEGETADWESPVVGMKFQVDDCGTRMLPIYRGVR